MSQASVGDLESRLNAAIEVGMAPAVWAQVQPDKVAVHELNGRTRTFADLNANANRIARLLREQGLGPGDSIALLCSNRVEFADVLFAALRVGVRMSPVNWHLTADEIAYIIENCEAKALFADADVVTAVAAAGQCPNLGLKVAIGGDLPGFVRYEAALARFSPVDIDDPVRGYTMLYSSGTTGRPKGVHKPQAVVPGHDKTYDRETDIHLCTGPAYHAAPLA
ncbi:MAG TPA: AMP-binding protein, partial [Phenylobacterium sp.]|nr:AMP-binding protein [Phenylobacterium sp.]